MVINLGDERWGVQVRGLQFGLCYNTRAECERVARLINQEAEKLFVEWKKPEQR